MDWECTLVVLVDVPWVGAGYRNLQVGYTPFGPIPEVLTCEWGDQHVLDGGTADFTVNDKNLTPIAAAQAAADWIITQLARPVERDDWLAPTDRVVASRWRLSDTGEVLGSSGNPLVRWARKPGMTRRVGPQS